jgi:small subunit ribosomal protein S4e
VLRNRLKYALTYKEVTSIVKSRAIKVDGKVRTEKCYPSGFMDVIDIDKTDEHFRLLYDTKGRFVLHRIAKEEAAYKLCRVKSKRVGDKGVPHLTLHDGKTIRYPDPMIKVADTVMLNLETGKLDSANILHLDTGMTCMINGGRNTGRVGVIASLEKHKGSFTIAHVKDSNGNAFTTRAENVFVIGAPGKGALISLPKGKGLKLSIVEALQAKKKAASA